jgi:TatD DNase family protein
MSSYGFGENLKPPVECCIHCFTGTTIDLATYRLWGFYIGLTGYIFSIPDNTLLEWLHIIGIDRLVIETDAPYMGFKGCRARQPTAAKKNYPNVPSALPLILDRICSVSSWNRNEVAMKTTRNVADFFRVSLD